MAGSRNKGDIMARASNLRLWAVIGRNYQGEIVIHSEDVQEHVRRLLAPCEDVVAAYVFGSVAEGKQHAHSDVDVAVLFDDELDAGQRFRRSLEVGGALETALRTSVDLVVLNGAPPLLAFRVIQNGVLAVENDRTQRCLFQMRAMNRYYDAKRFLEYQRAEAIRRIQQKGLGRGYGGDRDALAEARRLRRTLTAPGKRSS